jgi:hypothetical protein
MKSRCLLVCAALLLVLTSDGRAGLITSAGDPSLAGSTVITFESVNPQSFTSLTIGGVQFSVPAGQLGFISGAYGGNYNTTGQSLQNTYDPQAFTSLTITFPGTVNAFGFNWGASDSQWTLTALDTGNHVLDSHVLPVTYGSNAGDFVGLSAPGIAKVTLTLPAPNTDYVFIDNLHFAGAHIRALPEPASLALFAAGLVGVLGTARRRRS